MRLDTLYLENYRCFDEIRIDFDERLTVLVAPNGGGKTAVLEAIAIALSPFVGKTGKAYGKQFHAKDSRRTIVSPGLQSPFREILAEAEGALEDRQVSWRRIKKTENGVTTSKDASCLTRYAADLLNRISTTEGNANTILPIIAYYGTGRLWGAQRYSFKQQAKALLPRNSGYQGCLSPVSSFESFKNWFGAAYFSMLAGNLAHSFPGASAPEQILLNGIVKNTTNAVHFILAPYGQCWLDYDHIQKEIVITDPNRRTALGLDRQSDGVRAIVAMIGDIASRTSLLNPQFGSEAAKRTPGIVLIDEVDMHLHPAWQQQVLQSLREAFPNIQFIVTTHSPQVLSTVPAECIRILGQNADGLWAAERPREQTEGVESAHVMATVMNTDPVPDIEKPRLLKDYRALIEEGNTDSAEAHELRQRLEEHFGPKHPEILDCERLIRFQAFKRRQTRPEEG